MQPFRHEYYVIALKMNGGGYARTGNYTTKDEKATVFFNSPYQIIQWDVQKDWKGFYVIFSEDFYRMENRKKRITQDFPFLLSDNTVPLQISESEALAFASIFQEVLQEHTADGIGSRNMVYHHTQILLHKVGRLFHEQAEVKELQFTHRDNDVALVSRFKSLIESSFYPDLGFNNGEPHKVQYYSEKLAIHPNHLNAVVKRITSHSASNLIYKHLLSTAKSKLKNTDKSIKEIAFELYYNYPGHFVKFFKKKTGMTPGAFRG